jgi:hypothetical protein
VSGLAGGSGSFGVSGAFSGISAAFSWLSSAISWLSVAFSEESSATGISRTIYHAPFFLGHVATEDHA